MLLETCEQGMQGNETFLLGRDELPETLGHELYCSYIGLWTHISSTLRRTNVRTVGSSNQLCTPNASSLLGY